MTEKDSNLWISDEDNKEEVTPVEVEEETPVEVEEEEIIEEETSVEEETFEPVKEELRKGSRVRFTGTKSYSGLNISDGKDQTVYNVIEVSGDRIVIGRGTSVVSAVNARDCQLV